MPLEIRNMLSEFFVNVLEQNEGRCLDSIDDRLSVADSLSAALDGKVLQAFRWSGMPENRIREIVAAGVDGCPPPRSHRS